jgi:putative transcriptional regulator
MAEIFKNLEKGLKGVVNYFKPKDEGSIATVKERKKPGPQVKDLHVKPPVQYRSEDVKKIRQTLKCSQSSFAKLLNISIKTVQSWESGRRVPSQAALRLLQIFDDPRMRSAIFPGKKIALKKD